MSPYLKTNISNAFWCTSKDFEIAEKPISIYEKQSNLNQSKTNLTDFFQIQKGYENTINKISWFDSLFNGGIYIPEDQEKPLIMLLAGPPGSGKTTLAIELCLRVALLHNFGSLYISTESETKQLLSKAKGLGIKETESRMLPFNKKDKIKNPHSLLIYGQENIPRWETFTEIVKYAIADITEWMKGSDSKLVKKFLHNFTTKNGDVRDVTPDIVVFDNLNLIEDEEKHDFFEHIIKGSYGKTKLIVVMLDSMLRGAKHESWEFACDITIRLDYATLSLDTTSLRDYYIRQFEIVKARYQTHISGKQQLKINPPYDFDADSKNPLFKERIKRTHPFRKEGGIFIYPSIHFYLSCYKKQGNLQKIISVPTPLNNLNSVIKGFPEGRCTALIGCRGGHKSHLGYLHILKRIQISRGKETGIIISLRDDETMTKSHLTRILTEDYVSQNVDGLQKRAKYEEDATNEIERLIENNELEVLYFPPGYITADEFFHRMFMSVYRLRNADKKITLLFNSLDQLSARFPLCEHQPIFVPGIIEALSGEGVTSIFISVNEPGQPLAHHGLLPMADLILNFDRYRVKQKDYYELHGKIDIYDKLSSEKCDLTRECIFLEISRFAGGKQAGKKGLLELVYSDEESDSIIEIPGLHFNKWNYNYKKIW